MSSFSVVTLNQHTIQNQPAIPGVILNLHTIQNRPAIPGVILNLIQDLLLNRRLFGIGGDAEINSA